MLVLTRRPSQSVIIGADWGIIVSVVKLMNDGSVRIGFTANDSCEIHREEIRRKLDENAGLPEHPDVFTGRKWMREAGK